MFCQPEIIRKQRKQGHVTWSKPEPRQAKLNFNAGFYEEDKRGVWGAIWIDEFGNTILSALGGFVHCQNTESAEAMVGLQSLKAIPPIYVGQIQVENDCVALISELNKIHQS